MTHARYLPLLAKWVLAVGAVGFVAIAILYPQRQREAMDYAAAAACSSDVDAACRRSIRARVLKIDCPRTSSLHACALKLRVADRQLYLSLDRGVVQKIADDSDLTVETFRGSPTGAFVEGRFVREYGSPEMAIETMHFTMEVWSLLMAVALVYLWRRRRA